jgi:hypothetical protein
MDGAVLETNEARELPHLSGPISPKPGARYIVVCGGCRLLKQQQVSSK